MVLQWHIRTHGRNSVAVPVVHNYGNIECRDAVLAWDAQELALRRRGPVLSPGRHHVQNHPVTGEQAPDEAARCRSGGMRAQGRGRPTDFMGTRRSLENCGCAKIGRWLRGSTAQLAAKYPEAPDFVMFWWHHAAAQVAGRPRRRRGWITTNSLRWFSTADWKKKKKTALACTSGWRSDHPWVDSANGAAVRIAMTVLAAKRR